MIIDKKIFQKQEKTKFDFACGLYRLTIKNFSKLKKGMSMKIKNAALCLVLLSNISCFSENILDPVEEVFTRIYKTNGWWSGETVSGQGSELKVTHKMRQELSALIKRFGITSIADAPCGDLNWMRHVEIGTCRYIGIDIVQDLIEKNIKTFGSTREFRHLNLLENTIERVDLIICRDMLAHLTYEQAVTALRNFKQSGSKYILITTNVRVQENRDIDATGGWRLLNLEKKPFNFPRPLALIEEDVPYEVERGKHLALWFLEDINV